MGLTVFMAFPHMASVICSSSVLQNTQGRYDNIYRFISMSAGTQLQ